MQIDFERAGMSGVRVRKTSLLDNFIIGDDMRVQRLETSLRTNASQEIEGNLPLKTKHYSRHDADSFSSN